MNIQQCQSVVVWRTVSQGSQLQIGFLLNGLSILSLLCLLSPWMCLLLSFLPFNSFFVWHLTPSFPVSCFCHSFCPPPVILSPPHICPSYSLSFSHHSQYGIHNEGACYVRSNWAVWTLSGDVEIQIPPLWPNLAVTCDKMWRVGQRIDRPLLNKIISSCKKASHGGWLWWIKTHRSAGREQARRKPQEHIRALMDLFPSSKHVTERMQTPRARCPLQSPALHRLDWMKVLHKRAHVPWNGQSME